MPSTTSSVETATASTMETTTAPGALYAASKAPICVAAAPYGMRPIVWARAPRVKVAIKVTIIVFAVKASEASVVVKRRFSY